MLLPRKQYPPQDKTINGLAVVRDENLREADYADAARKQALSAMKQANQQAAQVTRRAVDCGKPDDG
jgi:hypothetical protein